MNPRDIVVIAHDLRSTHNVGSLLRTCEGLGVQHVYLSGYTPYPALPAGDSRLPHIAAKLTRQITKTALGTEQLVAWSHAPGVADCIKSLRSNGYRIVALEQTPHSIALPSYTPPAKIALVLGREVEGVDPDVLALCDQAIEIPMLGRKESFNVVQAAAITLYQLRFA